MHTKNVTFNKKIFYNPTELDTVYIIKLTEIIKVLDFKLLIPENSPCDTNSKDNKLIKPIKNI